MIRPAVIDDRDSVHWLCKEVYGDFMTANGITMVDSDLYKTVDLFITLQQALVVEHDGIICGMCAWLVSPHPANANCRIWQEVLWCLKSIHKTDALALIRAMEDKAKEANADVMILANLSLENEPKLRRIYGKRGFNYLETHYSRRRF